MIVSRPTGTKYIFQGLLKLPLLRKFSLSIGFIKDEEWVLLQEFLNKQTNLESINLIVYSPPSTRSRFESQKLHLESFIKALENKPLLKFIKLKSAYWSLEALSKGFGHLTTKSQLRILRIEASDETITTHTKSSERVKGLCNFIKNQKDTLKTLQISLAFAPEENTVTCLAEAISKVREAFNTISERSSHFFLNPLPPHPSERYKVLTFNTLPPLLYLSLDTLDRHYFFQSNH